MQIDITLAKIIESLRFLMFIRWIKLFNTGKRSASNVKAIKLSKNNNTRNETNKSRIHGTN